jgi:hypothetical protein
MEQLAERELARLAAAGLEKCLAKFNGVSPGDWRLEGLRVFAGTAADAAREWGAGRPAPERVRVGVASQPPFETLLLLNPAEADHLNGCFVNEKLYKEFGAGRRDTALLEIGNILLNALANSLLKLFGKTAIPSVPELLPPGHAPAGGAGLTLVAARLSAERGGRTARILLLALVPAELSLNK